MVPGPNVEPPRKEWPDWGMSVTGSIGHLREVFAAPGWERGFRSQKHAEMYLVPGIR